MSIKVTELPIDDTPTLDDLIMTINDPAGAPANRKVNLQALFSSIPNIYARLAGSAGGQTLIGGTGVTDILKLQGTSGNGTLTSPAIQLLVGNNGATIAATILNNGNVGIGTTTPSNLLHLYSTVNGKGIRIEQSGSGATGSWELRAQNLAGAASDLVISDILTGTNPMVIKKTSGNVGIGTATPNYRLELGTDSAGKPSTSTWTVVSDKRLKEEIINADLGLCYQAVKSIPLKYFKWKDNTYTIEQVRDRHKLGWMAEDVQKIYPKAVDIKPFAFVTEEVIEDCLSLNGDQVLMAMYGAVQELIQKVEGLEKKYENKF